MEVEVEVRMEVEVGMEVEESEEDCWESGWGVRGMSAGARDDSVAGVL